MELNILIYLLMIFPTYMSSQITLTESGGGLKKPGETLRLTCTVSGYSIINYGVNWVRQAPGKGLEWNGVIWSGGGTNYDSAFQNRMSITRDTSKNQVFFQLNGLKSEDSGIYYCARAPMGSGYGGFDFWGKGTTVTVTSATPKAPTVFPLSPSGQDISTASQVTFGCLVYEYFPKPATVQWNSGAITSGVLHFPPVLDSSSHYTHSSLLTIPMSQWKSESFQCNVHHPATNSSINKKIEPCAAREPVAPEVRLLHSSCNLKGSDGTIQLVCFVESFYPKEIHIEWLVGSHQGLLAPYTEPPKHDVSGYTFSTTSTVNITQADWLEGNTYYCQVTHEASQTKVKSRARKCEDDSSHISSGINTYLLAPRPKDLYINKNSKITCVVVNLEKEEGLKISWSREKQEAMHPELVEVTEEMNGTFTAVSRLRVSTEDWESGESFTCTMEYPGLPGPIVKTISKIRENSKEPIIHIYPPIEVTHNSGDSMILTSFIRAFYPADIDVQWQKNGDPISEDSYVNTPSVKEKRDDSFFLYSTLTISKSDWEVQDVYTCMAVHEALEMNFIQRSIEKSPGKH